MVGKRLLFGAIGVTAAAIAIAGVWLPGVPTVFPLIVALWALSKSSHKLRRKVEKLPILQVALVEARRFEQEQNVARSVKVIAQACAWGSVALVAITTGSIVITSLVALAAAACSIFMYLIPTRPKYAARPDATRKPG